MKRNFLSALLFLLLFSSVGFTSPVYLDCQDPEPDEWLDFLGIVKAVIPQSQSAVFCGLIPDSHMLQRHCSRHLSLQPFILISVPILSGPLRC